MSDVEADNAVFKWTQYRVQVLLEMVEARPFIWNTTLKEYRDRVKKDNAFKEIGQSIGKYNDYPN